MREQDQVMEIIELLIKEYPRADTRLNFTNRFELLIAVVLSAQSTDDQVNKVTAELFKKYNTPLMLAQIDLKELEELIRGVGLYKNKARNIRIISKIIMQDYGGEVPGDFNELLKLPGVGRKTANVVLSVGFNQPGLGVDTHVYRVAKRLGIVNGKNVVQIETTLKRVIPKRLWSKTHHLLIAHGRQICRARKPDCSNCILLERCERIFE
ncbi:MAG: endonuclease III [Syntrophomonadaceae bacterium]|jgi:endonuclease-3